MKPLQDDSLLPETQQPARELSPAARRALAEAQERRRKGELELNLPPEKLGRNGPEPVRYGDWEKNGIAVDF